MLTVNEIYEAGRRILNCEYFLYSPAETSTIIIPNRQIYINIPRKDSVISLLNSYLELYYENIKMLMNPDMETVR